MAAQGNNNNNGNVDALVKQYLLVKRAAVVWIDNVLQDDTLGLDVKDDFFHQLVDGVVLCRVMQKISPNLIPRIKMPVAKKRATLTVFKTNENVSFFVQACVEIGVPRQKRFVLHDLVNKKGVAFSYSSSKRVLECLEALCELANSDKKFEFNIKWPALDPGKEKFPKEDSERVKKMVEEYLKTEAQKEITEKRVSGSRFIARSNAAAAAAASTPLSPSSTPSSATTQASTASPSPTAPVGVDAQEAAKKKEIAKNKAAAKLQALVRGWLARNRYRAMVRSQAYRDHVAQEILSTERVYVEHLEFLVKEVLHPLRDNHKEQILTEVEIRAIFSETESILNYNKLLLLQLEERVAKWSVSQRLGDIFLLIANFLKIYSQYCSNYNEAMRILAECKKQTKFKKFLDDLKKRSHDIEHRGLEDYLIRPVQRIPRYYLLLQDLVKHTSKDHPDYANLFAAAQKVQAVAEYMNVKKKEAENIMKVTEIQEMIDGEYEPLAKPHRRFAKEGQLQEVTKGTTRKVSVVLFLFNDLLVVTKPQGSSFLSRNKAPRLLFYTMFQLAGTQTISLENTSVFLNAFQILRTKSKRSITVLASSPEAKEEWLTAINQEIAEARTLESEQDKRMTSAVKDKVADTMQKLEGLYHPGEGSPFLKMAALKMSATQEAPASPLSSSTDSDGDGASKRMSVREKRMQLMQSARRSGSLPSSPVTGAGSLTSSGE